MSDTGSRSDLHAQTVAASRALGQDPFLVLHGGGNTSYKDEDHLWAKASGFDLGHLTDDGLVQLRRADLASMLQVEALTDIQMMDGYAAATVEPGRPAPTIEALLHHALPFRSVLHTHADAIVALTDTTQWASIIETVYAGEVLAVPYVMPGFDLAKVVPAAWNAAGGSARAVILRHHGLFTMGDDVAQTLELHLSIVARAEAHLASAGSAIREPFAPAITALTGDTPSAAVLLDALARHAMTPVVALRCDDAEVRAFLDRTDLADLTGRGPTTLEHVIRTKRIPLIGDDVGAYVDAYRTYFERNRGTREDLIMLDPTPRIILHRELGLIATGVDERAATAAMDIYRHTIRVMQAAELLGGYQTLSESQAFDLEYWELEQRRLR